MAKFLYFRMGWAERISEMLEPNQCMYAVGQGALGKSIDRKTDR